MNVYYNDESISPLGLSDVKYKPDFFGPSEGTHEYTACGRGLSVIPVWRHKELGYGYILNFDSNKSENGSTQVFIPYTTNTASVVNNSIKIRSHSDVGNGYGWTPWRELVYKDEIENIVNSILSAKGLT